MPLGMRRDFSQVWAVLPTAAATFADLLDSPEEAGAAAPSKEVEDVIRIHGYIAEGCPYAVSPLSIMSRLDVSLSKLREVTLDIDSPGGSITGVAELAAYIALARQAGATIHAFTRGTCASAAYWIAAACSDIAATRGAVVGNCGAYAVYVDFSKANAARGVTYSLFTSGELKTAGNPDFPLTPAQRDFLAAHVGSVAEQFFADVFAWRPGANREAVRGGGFWLAQRALSLGLIDTVAQDAPTALPPAKP